MNLVFSHVKQHFDFITCTNVFSCDIEIKNGLLNGLGLYYHWTGILLWFSTRIKLKWIIGM